MAIDADSIVIAGSGSVHVAPTGSTLPTDVATALDAAFIDLGYINEDGATFNVERTTDEVSVWQSFYAPRRFVTDSSAQMTFTLSQWDVNTVPLAFGGGSIATDAGPPAVYTYTPPDPEDIDYRACVLSWEDGTDLFRLVIPRVMVSEGVDTQLVRSGESTLPITLAVLGTDGVSPWSLITNAAEFASA